MGLGDSSWELSFPSPCCTASARRLRKAALQGLDGHEPRDGPRPGGWAGRDKLPLCQSATAVAHPPPQALRREEATEPRPAHAQSRAKRQWKTEGTKIEGIGASPWLHFSHGICAPGLRACSVGRQAALCSCAVAESAPFVWDAEPLLLLPRRGSSAALGPGGPGSHAGFFSSSSSSRERAMAAR